MFVETEERSLRLMRIASCLQISQTLLDQDAVPFPFDQRALEQLHQVLRLLRIAAGRLQPGQHVFLFGQTGPALLDVSLRRDQRLLLEVELFRRIRDMGYRHHGSFALAAGCAGSSDCSMTRRIMSAYCRYSVARAVYICATASR